MTMDKEMEEMIKTASLCTLGLALALALNPGATMAQSHCKGLSEKACSSSTACKWMPEAKAGDKTKAGKERKTSAKAHCRLDVKAAGEIAKKSRGQ